MSLPTVTREEGQAELEPPADALEALIEEARRWERKRRLRRLVAAAAILALALLAFFGGRALLGRSGSHLAGDPQPDFPATPAGSVLYAVTELPLPSNGFIVPGVDGSTRFVQSFEPKLVELRSGRTRLVEAEQASWYDAKRREVRELVSVDGVHVSNTLVPVPPDAARYQSEELEFLTALQALSQPGGVRDVLAQGAASRLGETRLAGRRVLLLGFPQLNVYTGSLEFAVDARTGKALAYRLYCAHCIPGHPFQRIVSVREAPASSALLAAPPAARPSQRDTYIADTLVPPWFSPVVVSRPRHGFTITHMRPPAGRTTVFFVAPTVQPTTQRTVALRRPPLWDGTKLDGLKLTHATVTHAKTSPSHGLAQTNADVRVTYGAAQTPLEPLTRTTMPPSVQVAETRNPRFDGEGLSFTTSAKSVWTLEGIPVPPPGRALLLARWPYWTIQLERSGLYVTITATSRALALDAARKLTRA